MAEFWERFAFYGIRWAFTLYILSFSHNFLKAMPVAKVLLAALMALIWPWSMPRLFLVAMLLIGSLVIRARSCWGLW